MNTVVVPIFVGLVGKQITQLQMVTSLEGTLGVAGEPPGGSDV